MTVVSRLSNADVDQLVEIVDSLFERIDGTTHVTVAVVDGEGAMRAIIALPAPMPTDSDFGDGGPALAACLTGRIARIPSTELRNPLWPDYTRACYAQGIWSVTSFPMVVDGRVVGVLTVGSNRYCGFGFADTRIGQQAATAASTVLGAPTVGQVDALGSEPARVA